MNFRRRKGAAVRFIASVLTVYALLKAFITPLAAQSAANEQAEFPSGGEDIVVRPDQLFLSGDNIIKVKLARRTLRLEVDPGHSGPPIINPNIVRELQIRGNIDLYLGFGQNLEVPLATAWKTIDFGYKKKKLRIAWGADDSSKVADGIIGLYDLPHRRVTFELHQPTGSDTEQHFDLTLHTLRQFSRLGTIIPIAEKSLFAQFTFKNRKSYVSAPTGTFLATHREGGFLPDTDGFVEVMLGVRRPTRDIQLAMPLSFAGLHIDRFAVRLNDHGSSRKVGEIKPGDRYFDEELIVVSRRKRQGRADRLTRIGRDEFDHCSTLIYDLKAMKGTLACTAADGETGFQVSGPHEEPAFDTLPPR